MFGELVEYSSEGGEESQTKSVTKTGLLNSTYCIFFTVKSCDVLQTMTAFSIHRDVMC